MQQDNTLWILFFFLYSVVPLLSLTFLFITFAPKYRYASSWLRTVCLTLSVNGLIWSGLGFTLLCVHLTREVRLSVNHWRSHLGGIGVGLLISPFLSPEFRELCRRSWIAPARGSGPSEKNYKTYPNHDKE